MTGAGTKLRSPVTLRASSVRDCPRKAVLEHTAKPDRERSERERRFLYRGTTVGRDYLIFLATANRMKITVDSGPDWWVPPELRAAADELAGIIAERVIPWEHGYGHADGYLTGTRTIIECLSSANPSDDLVRSKMLQAVLYATYDPDAENAAVVVIDPADFTDEQIVLKPGTATWRALEDEVRDRVEQIGRWKQDGTLPPRVCAKPSDARSHFCLHAGACFDGWEPPTPEEIEADETLVDMVEKFTVAKRIEGDARRALKVAEGDRKLLQAALEEVDLPAGADVRVGPFLIRRTPVQRKPVFEWEKAEAAGVFEPGLYDGFFRSGASYSTFKAGRVDGSGDEYGDEAPW